MKYLISKMVINEAKNYAIKSYQHTFNYPGFESNFNDRKIDRITTGKIAEYWLYEQCCKLGINCILDQTGYQVHDEDDVVVCGVKIDCKASKNIDCSCQVQPSHDKHKGSLVGQYYLFFYIEENYIQPLGFIEKEWIGFLSNKILLGEEIRESGLYQKHGFSYFLNDSKSLINFEIMLKNKMTLPINLKKRRDQYLNFILNN